MATLIFQRNAEPLISPMAGTRETKTRRRYIRLVATVIIAVMVVSISAAAALQLGREYGHAIAVAQAYTGATAQILASDTARTLDRLRQLGTAFVGSKNAAIAREMVESGESTRVLNIALVNESGAFLASMRGDPTAAAPLSQDVLRSLARGPVILPFSDPAIGASPMTIVFKSHDAPARFVLMPLDPAAIMPSRALGQSALFTPGWQVLAQGAGMKVAPPPAILRQSMDAGAAQIVEYGGANSMIAVGRVPGWPLAAIASVPIATALAAWHAALPLYLFLIFGPALLCAVLALLWGRASDRAERARVALLAAETARDEAEYHSVSLRAAE